MSTNIIYIGLSLILLIIIIILVKNNFNKKKIQKLKVQNEEKVEELYKKNEDISNELMRCKKISKNSETIDLVEQWNSEFETLQESIREINKISEALKVHEKKNKYRQYVKNSKLLQSTIEYIDQFADEYYSKLKNYTDFEFENTQMALDLKERIKELNHNFDQKIRIYDFLNEDFVEKIAEVKVKINEFEKEQKEGNYPIARIHLKEAGENLDELEDRTNSVIDYYEKIRNIEEKFEDFDSTTEVLDQKEFANYATKIRVEVDEYKVELKHLKAKIELIKLEQKELINNYHKDLEDIETKINNNYIKLEHNVSIINSYLLIQEENQEKINLAEELIKGCFEERETIQKLYNVNNIEQFKKVEEQNDSFEKFNMDYLALINLIKSEDEDFVKFKENVDQTSKYLDRLLLNLKILIQNLEAIRSDEIEIRNKIDIYEKEVIDINLYLREQNHLFDLNKNLLSNYSEIEKKIAELEEELQKEPLDIGFVRTLNDIIEKLLKDFSSDIQTDIKQKKGVESLMLYYDRFINDDEYLRYYNHFLSLYNEKEYRQILREIHSLFTQIDEKGDVLYRNIVSKVKIEQYNSLI